MTTRRISDKGRKFIEREEDLRLQAYRDIRGVWTIGYGSTSGVQPGMIITQEQAEEMLDNDLITAETAVSKYVKVELNDNEFAALVSFTFNEGAGSLLSSTLLRCLNKGNRADAAQEFLKWNKTHINGVLTFVQDLADRRAREKALFLA